MSTIVSLAVILAAVLFIIGIKLLASPKTARRGNLIAAAGMIIALLFLHSAEGKWVWGAAWNLNYALIIVGILVGLAIGAFGAYSVKMTGMPQMVALFNGLGGGAAALVAGLEFSKLAASAQSLAGEVGLHTTSSFTAATMLFATLIGAMSFSGSAIALMKLEGRFEKPVSGLKIVNICLMLAVVVLGVTLVITPSNIGLVVMVVLSLVMGLALVLPIGGADMPVVISLLNSFTGLAVAADGFAINNTAMLVAGTLVGSSGTILTLVMCKAMNRPITNVIFSGFGSAKSGGCAVEGEMKEISIEDAYLALEAARSVVIVPGYGMAVAQAQHAVKELATKLEENGTEVAFAIHPVAGRMPGHMNVLLAEANVPYEQLVPMEDLNSRMETVDVAIVIGANDVVNPAAVNDPNCPIYGMPIVEAYKARTVFAIKRGKGAGFSGLANTLYFMDKTRMLYGDAKAVASALAAQFKEGA
jgi:H+-translocating NAD(P) transhydrogenase subunit beta